MPAVGVVKYADDAAGIAKYGDDITEGVEVVAEHGDEVVEGIAEESKIITRPSWRESELDAAKDFPEYAAQKSFIDGEEVPYGTKGSVRPDYYKPGHSVDIKNYSIETKNGRSNLARNIEKQYYQRIDKLPEGTKQTVMIDIRGQQIIEKDLDSLYDDIMKRTNNGITIIFKTE